MESTPSNEPTRPPSPGEKPTPEPVLGPHHTTAGQDGVPSVAETGELDRVLTRATHLFPGAMTPVESPQTDSGGGAVAVADAEGTPVDAPAADGSESADPAADSEAGVDEESTLAEERSPRKRAGVNVLSIVALVMAIALSPLAVVFGYLALGQLRRADQRGETVALWAIGLGWPVLAAWVVLIGSLIAIGVERGVTWEDLQGVIASFGVSPASLLPDS